MKRAFQLCDTCNLQPSCPTGVALDCFESGREVEIRTCKAHKPVKRAAATPPRKEETDGNK